MLAGAHDRAIECIEIHLVVIFDVAQHTHALKNVNVLAGVDNARHVVQVLGTRIAIFVFLRHRNHDGRPGRRKMHLLSLNLHIVGGILTV